MKKRILLIVLIGISNLVKGQITDTGDKVGIGTTSPLGKLHIETNKWSESLLTLKDSHYSPHQIYKFQIESDGLKIKQDNTINYQFKTGGNFIVNNGKVGIGTTSPLGKLHIETNKWSESLLTLKDSHYSPHQIYKFQIESDGLKIKQDNTINYQFKTGGNFIVNNGKVGIGTTTPDSKLSVNGNIHTKEVKVDLIGWSDFVFEKKYNLPTLTEVENHIKEKGHLKDIPSAKDVEKNGIFLGKMDAKLLQKIEELTLYTIQQEKEIKSLKSMNSKLIELQKRLEKLENK
jgi:hypothetical protein